ncbi:MAG: large repetitive protein, partial [Mycobacterium sp.]|nr:large repetitive protein [Mycobacterium sp.]
MCANTSRHRAGRTRAGTPPAPSVWAAKQVIDETGLRLVGPIRDAGIYAVGPRHAIKVTTSYVKYIGRVGALAVSLGVGMAVATTPCVAHAGTDPDSDAAASTSSGGADGQTASQSSTGPSTSNTTTANTTSTNTTTTATTDPEPTTSSSTNSQPATADGDGVPKMNVSSSGGAHTSTYGTDGKSDDTPAATSTHTDEATTPTSADTALSSSEQPTVVVEPTPEPTAVPVAEESHDSPSEATETAAVPETPPVNQGSDHEMASTQPSAEAAKGVDADTVSTSASEVGVQVLSVVEDDAPPVAADALRATAFSALFVPPPPVDPVAALLAVPVTVVNFFSGFVGALLTPFLAPSPAAPAQLPILWTVLAWVRREITHTFFNQSPIANPIQTVGQSLTGVVTGSLNASDPNCDPLTATVTEQGQYGTVALASNGTYIYTPNGAVPAGGITDTFQVTINDSGLHLGGLWGLVQGVFHSIAHCIGLAQPDTVVKTVQVSVAATGAAASIPSVVATSGVLLYTGNGDPKTLDPAVIVVDVDSTTASQATVKIGVGYNALTDTLAYSPSGAGPITGSFDAATGVLTLTGTATVTQYQDALRAVTFASTAPVAAKTVAIVVTADQVDSLAGIVAVVVPGLPTNVPSVVATTPVKLYTSGGSPVVLDANVTVIDVDSTTATGATVSFDPVTYDSTKDSLAYSGSGTITGDFDTATGVLTLSGPATVAQYQGALRSVTFASTAAAGVKTVSIVVSADAVDSLPGVIAVTVAALPVATNVPSVVATTPVKLYTSGGSPVVLDANVTVVDVDSTTAT